MKSGFIIAVCMTKLVFFAPLVFSQAFGEYGRAVGSVPHGKGITGSRTPGGVSEGNIENRGGGQSFARKLPARLTVIARTASLFVRQDEESERLLQLTKGETLVPMVQSEGGREWYLVKTEKGSIGWVKSADVQSEGAKK